MAWMGGRPWLASAIIWATGVVLVGLIVVLLSLGGGKHVDWAEVTALALTIPSIGIVGVAWGLHQRRWRGTMPHMTEEERLSALVEILLNPSARLDERDDAAMDLGGLGRHEAAEALLTVARDPGADIVLAASCGESLAEIALRNGEFDRTWLDGIVPTARMELVERLRHDAPGMLGTE